MMTLRRIIALHSHLLELTKMPTPIAYAIGKNLRIAERIIDDYEKIRTEIMTTNAMKDADGEARKGLYAITKDVPVQMDWPVDADTKVPEGHYVGYLFDDYLSVKEQIESILDEEHDVTWHRVPESRAEDCNVPALLLMPLYDTIIIEGR